MNLILLGAPGAGKGTQAEAISDALNIPQISTGNMLREAVKNGTEYGLKAKAVMEAGGLVSDDIVIGILKDRIAQDDAKNGFILDGFPRTVPQAEALDKMGVRIDKVVEIFVPDETIKERVSGRRVCEGCGASYHIQYKPSKVEGVCDKCGAKTVIRKDDEPATVISRLETYHEQTEPIKAYYEQQGKLETVIGQEEVADTKKLTLKAVGAEIE
ncbi:MAG: adenylate kinase [Oscillospiraceae bacterium]|nr:adenylate kinase [Oscillospiraceae bacterium]